MAEKYTSPYKYKCSEGHWLEGPKPLTECPMYFRGVPCAGVLTAMSNENRKASSA